MLTYNLGYPPTVNTPEYIEFALSVARGVAPNVSDQEPPTMGAEDFSYFLNQVPGVYAYIGNGDSAALHHPKYDFNDEAAAVGASYFARLVEQAHPLERAKGLDRSVDAT